MKINTYSRVINNNDITLTKFNNNNDKKNIINFLSNLIKFIKI